MSVWTVTCGMRPVGAFPAQTTYSTIIRDVVVEAASSSFAALQAIDECYRQWPDIEHVKPMRVVKAEVY